MIYGSWATCLLLFASLGAAASDIQSSETVVGWGVEYRLSATQDKFDFYAFSRADFRAAQNITKYSYRNVQRMNGLSCVPNEEDPEKKCSGSWFGPVVYIVALPVSLYLYKEMLGIK